MNNFIYYFYNIKVENLYTYQKYYTFTHNGYIYRLYQIEENINSKFIIDIDRKLLGYTLINEIIFNKDKDIISTYNNKQYILMKIYTNTQKKITLEEIYYLANTLKVPSQKIKWSTLWERKIDYLEKIISENGKKYPLITDSFNYFIGMTENAISYYNNIEFKQNDNYVISHKRIRYNDNIDVIYNPLNIIFDYRIRDIAEYIKNSFFNNNQNIYKEIHIYLKKYPFTIEEAKLLVSRLLYPSFYFELYEDILIDNVGERVIIDIINKLPLYEKYLSNIITYLSKIYNVEEIIWLKH